MIHSLARQPSTYTLQALADIVVWSIRVVSIYEGYANTAAGNLLGRFAAESLIQAEQTRATLLMNTATGRYLRTFTERPQDPAAYSVEYCRRLSGDPPLRR